MRQIRLASRLGAHREGSRSKLGVILGLQLLPPISLATDTHLEDGGAMRIERGTAVSLFVHHRTSGRLVFNQKAIEALGLSPAELALRGYPLDDSHPAGPIETSRSRSA